MLQRQEMAASKGFLLTVVSKLDSDRSILRNTRGFTSSKIDLKLGGNNSSRTILLCKRSGVDSGRLHAGPVARREMFGKRVCLHIFPFH